MAVAVLLLRRIDIEVVQAHRVGQRLQRDEADAPAIDHEVVHGRRIETARQVVTDARFVVAAQPFQARTHGAQAQCVQGLEVIRRGGLQDEAGRHGLDLQRTGKGFQRLAWRMCSSTSLALAGIGVPGP